MIMSNQLDQEYKRGYQAGLKAAAQQHDDAYWLRQYAGMAIGTARLQEQWREEYPVSASRIAIRAVEIAVSLLTEVKKAEEKL